MTLTQLFCLTVDDFGIRYTGKPDALHLRDTLQEHYTITEDWEGNTYCGINILWNYKDKWVDISMDGYVQKALQRFKHPKPTRPQHAPSKWTAPIYGAKQQFATAPDTTPLLDDKEVKTLQELIGVFLFYARAVDNTLLVALGSLASAQARGTQATRDAACHLLNYLASHPDATVRFRASQMQVHAHSDASYLSEPEAKSRVAAYFFLGDKDNPNPNSPPPQPNGAIHVLCKLLRNVVASAAEAEVGGLFRSG